MPEQKKSHPKYLKMLAKEGKKGNNKLRILQYIFDNQKTSVSKICESLDLSAPTTLNLLSELTNAGWIEKKGAGKSVSGRRPDLIGLVSKSLFVLCIDLELSTLRMGIFDNTLEMQTEIYNCPFSLSINRENMDILFQNVTDFLKSKGISLNQLAGISMTMPGLINSETGENFSYLVSNNNDDESMAAYCSKVFGVPVTIQNDVKAAALAELRCGKASGKQNALIILMDWGLGLGIVMDGKVRRGASGFSGEIGHIPFEDNGELCYCGKHGCLETVASGNALSKMAKAGIASGQNSILNELSNREINKIETSLIINAANKGDLYAIQLLSKIGTNIGKGISTLIQIFNPEVIVLEGRIAAAKQYITIPMLQSINTYCMTQIREKTQITSSDLGETANLMGGAIENIDRMFQILLESRGK
ncbi:MAG: ROK family transcriptional regulator [Arachidicoccus sp.]|nr:ROK family transcriptional regulator [Arachidicoccus sp.]